MSPLACAEALWGIRGSEAKDALAVITQLLKDKETSVRWRAAQTLQMMGPDAKTAIPALTELLNDKDENVRKAAAEALEKIKNN